MTTTLGPRSSAEDVLAGRDLTGRNMLVTGCNAGIGYETARALAAHGALVILACRDQKKAEETASRILSSHPGARVRPLAVDLGSFVSIRKAAAQVGVEKLDALICNAGLYPGSYAQTTDGIERAVGVCHFGHFLLVNLLLDKLKKAAPARVVMVASESHRFPPKLDFTRFPLSRSSFTSLVAYGQAKLCNVLFANELTRRFAHEGVVANALHPGSMIGTSIFRDSMSAKLLAKAVKPFTKTIAQGAATTVYVATATELNGKGGQYFADCRVKSMSSGAQDHTTARQLWNLSEQLIDKLSRSAAVSQLAQHNA